MDDGGIGMKKVLGLFAVFLLMAAPALAAEAEYNCDYQPSCEVAPGIYGKMSSPVTSKFKLSIGGYVKLDYAYNSKNLGSSGVISPGSGAIPANGITANTAVANSATYAKQHQSILSMRQSRLWLKVGGPTLLGAKTGALIEGDFYGDPSAATESTQFRMRLAYGTIDWTNTQVLFGQFWDNFAPMVASTQDFRSGSSWGAPNSPRIPQIKLTQKINFNADNQLNLVAAVQDPNQFGNNQSAVTGGYGANVNYAGQVFFVSKALGVAPGYFGMSMKSLTLGAFGLYGSEKAFTNANTNLDTYGYGLYTFIPVLKSKDGKNRAMTMSLEGQTYVAANMSFNGATSTTVVGTPSLTNIATPNTTFLQFPAKNWAAAAQIIFYPIQDLGITAGWGARYALNNGSFFSQPANANYQIYNQEIYGNVTYDLNAAIRVAAEYQNLKTVYGNVNGIPNMHTNGSDNTVRFCAYYFF
jgi:hypothetical protein